MDKMKKRYVFMEAIQTTCDLTTALQRLSDAFASNKAIQKNCKAIEKAVGELTRAGKRKTKDKMDSYKTAAFDSGAPEADTHARPPVCRR